MPVTNPTKATLRRRAAQVVVVRASRVRSIYVSTFGAVISGVVSAVILAWWTVMVMRSRLAALVRRAAARMRGTRAAVSTASARKPAELVR